MRASQTLRCPRKMQSYISHAHLVRLPQSAIRLTAPSQRAPTHIEFLNLMTLPPTGEAWKIANCNRPIRSTRTIARPPGGQGAKRLPPPRLSPAARERSDRCRPLEPPCSSQADKERSDCFRPLGAPCSAKTSQTSGGRGLCDSERSSEHPSGAEKAFRGREPSNFLREGGGFHKESFSCKETQQKPETADVNPPSIPHRHFQAVSALIS